MKKQISRNIINQTTRCNFEKKCLASNDYPLCTVENISLSNTIFVCKTSLKTCAYVIGFGMTQACGCPIRKELNRIHKI